MTTNSPPDDDDGNSFTQSDGDESEDQLIAIEDTVDLCNITYSRAETIAAFTDYLDFLTKMYMDADAVHLPPEGGWSEITVESMRDLGKTDEVAELLRHLPYVRSPDGAEIHAGGGFELLDWSGRIRDAASDPRHFPARVRLLLDSTEAPYENVPPHVVGLTTGNDYQMFLDTHLGVIYFPGNVHTPGPSRTADEIATPWEPVADEPEDYAPVEEEWRHGGTGLRCAWSIPNFFEMLKYHFRELKYNPISRTEVKEAFDRGTSQESEDSSVLERAFPMARDVFREHGWPDMEKYDKEKCMDVIEPRMEAIKLEWMGM